MHELHGEEKTMSNDKTEPISAKLRRWTDESLEKAIFPECVATKEVTGKCKKANCLQCEIELFRHIADEIDREKREITERYARQSWMNPADTIAKLATGEIEFHELKNAINRYYLPRPLFEDGEPVQDSDLEEIGGLATCCVYTDGSWRFDPDKFEDEGNPKPWDKQQGRQGDRVKRPKQQVLDADGVPIEVGDKVWLVPGEYCDIFPLYGYKAGVEYTVGENYNPEHRANGRICITRGDCLYGYPKPEQVTHREPDTQKRIDRDALKDQYEYWGCTGTECMRCPALVDGKKPRHRYGVDWCKDAKLHDLLRRQRELDGRDA